VGDAKGARDVHPVTARLAPLKRLAPLVGIQPGRPSHVSPARFGSYPSFARPGADQRPIKLRKATQHRQHQAPVRLVVLAHVSESDLKPAPALLIVSRMLSKSRVCKPIKPCHHDVAHVEPPQQLRQLGPVRAGTTHLLGINLPATSRGQCRILSG